MDGWIGEACEQLSCKFDCHHRGECILRLVVRGSGGGDSFVGGNALDSMESQTLDLPFNGASDDAKEIEGACLFIYSSYFVLCGCVWCSFVLFFFLLSISISVI